MDVELALASFQPRHGGATDTESQAQLCLCPTGGFASSSDARALADLVYCALFIQR